MAGAGFRTFAVGEVLTAVNVNTFLMQQAVMVFADAAARTTALPTPSEGMVTYLEDTNAIEKYSGASWVDITADSIAKALVDAKGDIITATADNTPARLAVGTNGQVLTADSSTATGLKWAAAGGKVLQVVAATHSTEVTTTGTTFIDTGLTATITPATSGSRVLVLASQTAAAFNPSGTNAGGAFRLVRNSTEVWKVGGTTNLGITIVGASATNLQNNQLLGMAYLDSPSTASAVTYKTQLRSTTATTIAQPASSTSSIVLIEIGA
jgi:hypothetical protein